MDSATISPIRLVDPINNSAGLLKLDTSMVMLRTGIAARATSTLPLFDSPGQGGDVLRA